MSSYFFYFRPLGIQGAYTIGIILDLHPKQHEEVYVRRERDVHCGRCGKQSRLSVEEATPYATPPHYALYYIDQIVAGDEIEVTIRDERLEPYQTIIYKPDKIQIVAKTKPVKIGNAVFRDLNFHPIQLIDTNNATTRMLQLPGVQQFVTGTLETP